MNTLLRMCGAPQPITGGPDGAYGGVFRIIDAKPRELALELSRAVGTFTDTASWKDRVSLTDGFRSAAYDGDMEIEIAALGDGRYEVITPRETDGAVTLATEEALKDLLRMRGMSDTQIATIVDELQPAPRKIRVVVNPSGSPG